MNKAQAIIQDAIDKGIPHGEIMEHMIDALAEFPQHAQDEIYDKFYCAVYGKTLSREIAQEWVHSMSVTDKSERETGEKWTVEDCEEVARKIGIEFKRFNKYEWYAVMNMCYSDYFATARHYDHSDDPLFFARLAYDWLDDSDAPDEKAYLYYFEVVKAKK